MTEWKRHLSCGIEIKDYFDLVSENNVVSSVFIDGNGEWVLTRRGCNDIYKTRSEAFDFAEASCGCEGIKRIRNRK